MAYDPVSGLVIQGGNQYNTYGYGGFNQPFGAPMGSPQNPIGQHLNSPYYSAAHPQAGFNALGMTLGGAMGATNTYNQQLYGQGGAFEQAFGALDAMPGVAEQQGQQVMDVAGQQGQQAINTATGQFNQIVEMGGNLNQDVADRVDAASDRAEKAAAKYDSDSYAAISAAASSISEQTQQSMMDLDGVAGMDMTPGMKAAMKQDMRMSGMKSLQGTIAPMQQQQQLTSAQLGMNVAAMMQQGAGLVSQTGLGVMGQVNAAGSQVNAATQFAGSLSANATQQAAQMNVSAQMAQVQGYQSLSGAIAAAPPQFVNFFDTFMQGQFLYDQGIVGYNTPTSVTGGFYGMFG